MRTNGRRSNKIRRKKQVVYKERQMKENVWKSFEWARRKEIISGCRKKKSKIKRKIRIGKREEKREDKLKGKKKKKEVYTKQNIRDMLTGFDKTAHNFAR